MNENGAGPPEKQPYYGGNIGIQLKPRFQALYREVRSRDRAIKLAHIFWPEDLELPKSHILTAWFDDVEEGRARVPKNIQEWIRGQIEQDESHAYREMAMAYAEAGKELAKQVKAGENIVGGVVALKYLADGAGFVAGKRAEIAGNPAKKAGIQVGNLSISVAPPKRKSEQLTEQVIDGEVRELPSGSPD